MPLRFRIRHGDAADLGVLEEMLYEAVTWDPARARPAIAQALSDPAVARYLAGWGRPGDAALVAVATSGYCVGAAWYRLFSADEPGFGFIDEGTPELAIGVVRPYRGRGVGSALLAALLERAGAEGYAALSLCVEKGNPAVDLYRRHGFSERVEREGALVMLAATGQLTAG